MYFDLHSLEWLIFDKGTREDMENTDDIIVYNDIGQRKIYTIDKWIRFSLGKGVE